MHLVVRTLPGISDLCTIRTISISCGGRPASGVTLHLFSGVRPCSINEITSNARNLLESETCQEQMAEAKVKLSSTQPNNCNLEIVVEVLCDGLPTGRKWTDDWEGECNFVIDLGENDAGVALSAKVSDTIRHMRARIL